MKRKLPNTASVRMGDPALEKHLRSADLFNVDKAIED